jgi:membrane protease YdiL (CAAX protease family)
MRRIGLGLSRLPRGLLVGFGYGLLALLVVQGAGYLLTAIYALVHFEHPTEHELLAAMKDAPHAAKVMLVIGACVMAPVFEELLFRGHLQTLLTRLFTPSPAPIAMHAPVAFVASPFAPQVGEVLPLPPLPVTMRGSSLRVDSDSQSPAPSLAPSAAMRWLAVILTSIVFALVHPLWMAPLIFVLSLCLGYAYERTGTLWVPIVMHAVFNTSSTVVFLNFM